MTVTLLIGQEEIKVDNSLLRKSQLFKEGINDLGQRAVVNSDREDVDIVVSARYLPVIDIYLDFINKISYDEEGKVVYPDSLRVINNIETLILCFYMESFFGDSAFLVYLMGQAYNMWNEFLPHIEGLPGERLIYLYTPYEFVPWHHIDTPSFFKEWLAINGNTEIVLNGKYHYFTEVVYYPSQQLKQLKVYHTVDGREVGGVVGKGYEAGWYEDENLCTNITIRTANWTVRGRLGMTIGNLRKEAITRMVSEMVYGKSSILTVNLSTSESIAWIG